MANVARGQIGLSPGRPWAIKGTRDLDIEPVHWVFHMKYIATSIHSFG